MIQNFNPNDMWNLDPELYELIYQTEAIISVYQHQQNLLRKRLQPTDVLIDVGVGTGRSLLPHDGSVSALVGIDISEVFLNYIESKYDQTKSELVLIHMDAKLLNQALAESIAHLDGRRRLIISALNTLGVFKTATERLNILKQMIRAAGESGAFFLTLFNANLLRLGIKDYYKRTPRLFGEIRDLNSDEEQDVISESKGFLSHWFTLSEIQMMFRQLGVDNYRVEEHNIAFFVSSF